MNVTRAGSQAAEAIARIYQQAFTPSVQYFFADRAEPELVDFLALCFRAVFSWGGQALVAADQNRHIQAYCLYLEDRAAKREYRQLLALVGKLSKQVQGSELAKLIRNQLLMTCSIKGSKKVPKPQARIVSIAVTPAYQGQGVGTMLFRSVLTELQNQSITLNVRRENPPARRLYVSAGFEEYGATKDLLGDWIMLYKPPES